MILEDPKSSFDSYESAKTTQFRDFKDFMKKSHEDSQFLLKCKRDNQLLHSQKLFWGSQSIRVEIVSFCTHQ